MYPVRKTLSRSELETAARRMPCLKLLPALSPDNRMDMACGESGNLTVVADMAITLGDFDEVTDLG